MLDFYLQHSGWLTNVCSPLSGGFVRCGRSVLIELAVLDTLIYTRFSFRRYWFRYIIRTNSLYLHCLRNSSLTYLRPPEVRRK